MQIERFNFREFNNEAIVLSSKGMKLFTPAHKAKEEMPAEPPPPTFTSEELDAARREGFQQGFMDGMKEGRMQAESEQADIDRTLTGTVETFAQAIAPLLADYRDTAVQLREQLPQIALAIAKKVAGEAMDTNATALVEATALRWAETMIHEPKLKITVHTGIAETLERKLEQLKSREQAATDIIVTRDDALKPTDCRIEWKHGAMHYQSKQLWRQLETITRDMGEVGKRETLAQLDALAHNLLPSPPAPEPTETKE